MVQIARRSELAVKIESTAGTKLDPALDGTESLIIVYDAEYTPNINVFARDPQRATFGKPGLIAAQQVAGMSFRVELRRTGSTHTEDAYADLLKACGFFATINSSTSVVYKPTSVAPGGASGQSTLTMHLWKDGVRYVMFGAQGNVTFSGIVGEPMFMNFEFQGIYSIPIDDALNSITHETGTPEAFQGVSLSAHGQSPTFSTYTLNMNNDVQVRPDANAAEGVAHAVIVGRDPTIEIDPEQVALSTKNWLSTLTGDTIAATNITPDSAITLNCPKTQLSNVAIQERNGVVIAGLTLMVLADTDDGDDGVVITMT